MRAKVFARNKPTSGALDGHAPFDWHGPESCAPVTHKSLTDADLGGQACGCLEPAFEVRLEVHRPLREDAVTLSEINARVNIRTEPGPDIVGRVPLISWVQAGHWSEIVDNFHPGDAEKWLPCPVKHSDRTFVLRVRGESMYNPYGRPSFQEGDLIFVDPERQADHGSFVVVRLDDEQEATFKKLIVEGGKRYLRALNPAWPEPIIEIDDNATICGVVIFKGEKL